MARYIVKRLLMMIPVLVGVSLIVFCISGSNYAPVVYSVGGGDLTDEQFAELEHELGFDEPILIRYVKYMGGMVRGVPGRSGKTFWEAVIGT